MSNPGTQETPTTPESSESFADLLSQYERSHKSEPGDKQITGTVIAVSSESVFVDIGFKTEGILPLTAFPSPEKIAQPGATVVVSVKGRNPEGYYELSLQKLAQPKDWTSLTQAFTGKATVVGTVTGVVKGGLTVDVGVRAFMPASRSGARDAAEMEKLVGQEIRCRITKLDEADEDVVVDRRVIVEEEDRSARDRRYSEVKEGETVSGTVRSLMDYGAFVDLGGVDGLLHISDMAWSRVAKPADVLSVGDTIDVKVLKIDPESRRISLGIKQLQPHPWDSVPEKYRTGERVRGVVTRVMEFGGFVELEPGIEGMIHVSEMSWARKVRKAGDLLKTGESVEAIILGINLAERRIALGLKQTLGDPWAEVAQRFAPGTIIEGPVTSFTRFGAFVQLSEGVEGMIHISEISAEKRLNHPQDVLKLGQQVKAQVLEVDKEKRQVKLSIRKMLPVSLDEYIAEHHEGETVTGRLVEVANGLARVELGEGIEGACRINSEPPTPDQPSAEGKLDMSSLSSMLKSRWKNGAPDAARKPEAIRAGQIRSFRITRLDSAAKRIELELS